MDEQFSNHEYRTGPTAPRKNRGGAVSVLLMLIIFFSGVVCAMGLLNIRLSLWPNRPQPETAPLSFSQGDGNAPALDISGGTAESVALAGMTCQELTSLCQDLYDLPDGLYIATVSDGSHADLSGIAPGDVLTHFAGTPISDLPDLQDLIGKQTSGARVEIITYRSGQQLHLTLALD